MQRPLVILAYPKIDYEKDYVHSWMPFSLLAIARDLLSQGSADVMLFDGNQSPYHEWESLINRHLDDAICLGVSIMTGGGQIRHALRMIESARARADCPPVVLGGPHVNVLPEQTLDHHLVDAVLVGPGQNSMPAYVEALTGQRGFDSVPGLMMSNGMKRITGPVNSPRTEMHAYPWELIDLEAYVRDDPSVAPRTLNYVSSLGCIYKCRFCYELTYARTYSAVSAEELIEDVQWLCNRSDLSGIKFYDADFMVNFHRCEKFCRGLIERGVNIRWAATANPNDIKRAQKRYPDFLERLAKSGCSRLLIGVESGSDRVLNEIVNKETTKAEILRVASDIANVGIIGSYTFIVGFPDETSDEQEQTYELIEQLHQLPVRPETRVHVYAPYPGTPLYESALRAGFVPPSKLEQWSTYDYYSSQTPWTSKETVARARANTIMRLSPKNRSQDQKEDVI